MKSAMNFEEHRAMKEKRDKKIKSKDKMKYSESDDMSVLLKKRNKQTQKSKISNFRNNYKNYQYDLVWISNSEAGNGTISYMNAFEAVENDAIAAVGTYFNQSSISYKVEIFVDDVLKLTQQGISPYLGYHTIKLNEYIPIKKGDVFKAVITSNAAPTVNLTYVRSHYAQNVSFISFDGENWEYGNQ